MRPSSLHLFSGHRGQQASRSCFFRLPLDGGWNVLCRDEGQPRRRRPPFASLLVRGICRQRVHVVPPPPWEVTVGEGFPVECFCCLRATKRRSGWHYTRAVFACRANAGLTGRAFVTLRPLAPPPARKR